MNNKLTIIKSLNSSAERFNAFISNLNKEEFEINIKSLTFDTAEKANNSPYLRRMVLTGSGSRAKVLDEANFLKSNFPKSSNSPHYHLGIGDQISFAHLNEFETKIAQWPNTNKETEYLLGPGDELSFAQSNDISQKCVGDEERNPPENDMFDCPFNYFLICPWAFF